MDTRQVQPRSRIGGVPIAFAYGIGWLLVVGSATYGILELSTDDCVTVATQFGGGGSQSAETCS